MISWYLLLRHPRKPLSELLPCQRWALRGWSRWVITLVWIGDQLVFMTALFSQWPAPGGLLGGNRPRLLWGMVAAMRISLAVSTTYTLHLACTHGAANLQSQIFSFAATPSNFGVQ